MKKYQYLYLFSLLLLLSTVLSACGIAEPIQPTPTPDPLITEGIKVYTARCAQCHALEEETAIIGPSLAGIATRAETRIEGYDAQAYIELSILRPDAYLVEGFNDVMPKNFGKEITSEQFNALIAYLMTLK